MPDTAVDQPDAKPRKLRPGAEIIKMEPHWRSCRSAMRRHLQTAAETGRRLIKAKADLERDGLWLRFLKDLPMGERQAQTFMKIARHPVLSDPQRVALLPPSWGTQSELFGVPAEAVEAGITNGDIHPAMTRKDAKAWASPHKPARPQLGKDTERKDTAYDKPLPDADATEPLSEPESNRLDDDGDLHADVPSQLGDLCLIAADITPADWVDVAEIDVTALPTPGQLHTLRDWLQELAGELRAHQRVMAAAEAKDAALEQRLAEDNA